jgi:chemotaxis signal transduction protein
MTILTPRRLAKRRVEPTQQLILFRLQQEWFALPILMVQKVVPLGQVYGASVGNMSLMHYQNLEIPIIDIEHWIFRKPSTPSLFASSTLDTSAMLSLTAAQSLDLKESAPEASALEASVPVPPTQPHLLITSNSQGDLCGIPINSQPMLQRVPESAFKRLPAVYKSGGSINCVSALIVLAKSDRPAFLLDLHRLIQISQSPDANHF